MKQRCLQNRFLRKKRIHLSRARLIQVLVHASSGSRPSDKGWGRSQRKVFSPFQASVWSKNKGETWAPGPPGPRASGPLPWMCHSMQFSNIVNIVSHFDRDDGDLRQEGNKLPLSNGHSLFQACTGSDWVNCPTHCSRKKIGTPPNARKSR